MPCLKKRHQASERGNSGIQNSLVSILKELFTVHLSNLRRVPVLNSLSLAIPKRHFPKMKMSTAFSSPS